MATLGVTYTTQLRDMLRNKLASGDFRGAAASMNKIREIIRNGLVDRYGNYTENLIAVVNHYYDVFLLDVPHPGDDVLSIYDRGGPSLTLVSLKPHITLDDATKEAWGREAAASIRVIVTDIHIV